jgi:uncharacterized protein (TIGR02001 family)
MLRMISHYPYLLQNFNLKSKPAGTSRSIIYKFVFLVLATLHLSNVIANEVLESSLSIEPEKGPISANLSIVNNYVVRGISQTNFKPAIQGGIEYAHQSGFYAGNWNSTISWIANTYGTDGYIYGKNAPGQYVRAPLEMDFYAGYKSEWLAKDFVSDAGIITYYYPTSGIPDTSGYFTNPNTTEIYAAQNFTFGTLTGNVKFSYAITPFFGTANSAGSFYPEMNLEYDTGVWGITLNGHVGMQRYAGHIQNQQGDNYAIYYSGEQIPNGTSNNSLYSYTDWKFTLNKSFEDSIVLALSYSWTTAKNFGPNGYAFTSPQGKNLGGPQGVISLSKFF